MSRAAASSIPVLQAILDADVAARAGWPILDLASAYLRGGARLLQLRAKSMPGDRFLATAAALVLLTHKHQARIIINDRADLARLSAAKGGKTRAVIKLLGRGAIMLAVSAFDVATWMLWAALMLFGFVCSLKTATERMTLRYLRWRKARRVCADMRALALASARL